MKKLEKLNPAKFEAKRLNMAQQRNLLGGTHIKTGETGGSDSNALSQTGFPIYNDTDLANDPIIIQPH